MGLSTSCSGSVFSRLRSAGNDLVGPVEVRGQQREMPPQRALVGEDRDADQDVGVRADREPRVVVRARAPSPARPAEARPWPRAPVGPGPGRSAPGRRRPGARWRMRIRTRLDVGSPSPERAPGKAAQRMHGAAGAGRRPSRSSSRSPRPGAHARRGRRRRRSAPPAAPACPGSPRNQTKRSRPIQVLELAQHPDARGLLRSPRARARRAGPARSGGRGARCTGGARPRSREPSAANPAPALVCSQGQMRTVRTRPETHARQPAPAGGPEDVRAAPRADRPGAPWPHPLRCGGSRDAAALVARARRRARRGAHHGAPGARGAPGRGISGGRAEVGGAGRARASRRGVLSAARRRARRSAAPPRLSRAARALRGTATGAPRLGPAPRAFRPGLPALDLFPVALWSRIVGRAQARASARLLEGGDPAGHRRLRRAIAEHVVAARGARCAPDQVFITGGTQQAYEEVLRLVVDPGDPVWLEDPGYLGARRAVVGASARPVPVPVDDGGARRRGRAAPGLRGRGWPSSRRRTSTRSGVTLSLPRRMALLRWAGESARSSWRTTTTASSATVAARSPRSRGSMTPDGWSTRARSARRCSRDCGSGTWSSPRRWWTCSPPRGPRSRRRPPPWSRLRSPPSWTRATSPATCVGCAACTASGPRCCSRRCAPGARERWSRRPATPGCSCARCCPPASPT